MTKENDYIWITDEVDASYFSMSAPQQYGSRCHAHRPQEKCCNYKEMNNRIIVENVIQVAVAWAGGTARNRIDNDIDSDDKSGKKVIKLCCDEEMEPLNLPVEEEVLEDKKKVLNKVYDFDAIEGNFILTITKDGEVSINGLNLEETEEEV